MLIKFTSIVNLKIIKILANLFYFLMMVMAITSGCVVSVIFYSLSGGGSSTFLAILILIGVKEKYCIISSTVLY